MLNHKDPNPENCLNLYSYAVSLISITVFTLRSLIQHFKPIRLRTEALDPHFFCFDKSSSFFGQIVVLRLRNYNQTKGFMKSSYVYIFKLLNPRSAKETYTSAKILEFSRIFLTHFPCSDLYDFFTQRQQIHSTLRGRHVLNDICAFIMSASSKTAVVSWISIKMLNTIFNTNRNIK